MTTRQSIIDKITPSLVYILCCFATQVSTDITFQKIIKVNQSRQC